MKFTDHDDRVPGWVTRRYLDDGLVHRVVAAPYGCYMACTFAWLPKRFFASEKTRVLTCLRCFAKAHP